MSRTIHDCKAVASTEDPDVMIFGSISANLEVYNDLKRRLHCFAVLCKTL